MSTHPNELTSLNNDFSQHVTYNDERLMAPAVLSADPITGKPLHDLGDSRTWGNSFTILQADDGNTLLRLQVFRAARIEKGHYLALPATDGKRVRYVVEEIRTPMDPGDHHCITARFAPLGKGMTK